MKVPLAIAYAFAFVTVGCSPAPGSSTSQEEAIGALGETEAACVRPLAPANRMRKAVVSHPFGTNPNRFEVLDLASTGELTKTGTTFEMGTGGFAPIVFTPDGEIGLVAQENGSIGVFRFDASGAPTVVNASLEGDFYARSIVMDPRGNRAFVLDPNVSAGSGGVYELTIGCDGTVTPKGRFVPAIGVDALTFMPGTDRRAVLFAKQALSSSAGRNTFLLDTRGPSLLAQGDGFEDQDAIVSSIAISDDGKYALVADDSILAGNRLSVVALPSMKRKQTLATTAPFAVVMSTFGKGALVVNGDSADELTSIRYDRTNADEPFSVAGPITYVYERPQLPGAAVQLTRGALAGRVLVAELFAVRQVQFDRAGHIADAAQTTWDSATENIVGTLGVQP